jgi:hypothetical protein
VQLLTDPYASVTQIAKFHRVSTHTVRAIRHSESQTIAERKSTLLVLLANVAELGAERIEETMGRLACVMQRSEPGSLWPRGLL